MTNYEIPDKIERYTKRVAAEYKRKGDEGLASVLERSIVDVRVETAYDNWDGGVDGHDVIFQVPDDLMIHIPLDRQQDIQNRITRDLNTASSSVPAEYINAVHFEFSGETEEPIDGESINRIWKRHAIKLFVSHRDTDKIAAHQLAEKLEKFGVSSFVAHDSIEPDEEWQREIEKALQSMDVMLALITENFFDSAWTNQEIGFALGRGIPVISLKVAKKDPIGFIGRRQAIKCPATDLDKASQEVWSTIQKRLENSETIEAALVNQFVNARSFENAKETFEALKNIVPLSPNQVDVIATAFNTNSQLSDCWHLTRNNRLVDFLNRFSPKPLAINGGKIGPALRDIDDEIPF